MEFDEAGFIKYLLYDVLVRKGTEVYYTYWVRQFMLEYQGVDEDWESQLGRFLARMCEAGEAQEWQAGQAEKAIRTYFTGFLELPASGAEGDQHRPAGPVEDNHAEREEPLDAGKLLGDFRVELGRQNCGAATETMYVSRVAAFLDFLEDISDTGVVRSGMRAGAVKYLSGLANSSEGVSQSDRKQVFTALLIFFNLVVNEDISGLRYLLERR